MDIKARLLLASKTGEVLIVKYDGGSRPGSSRKISPIALDEHKVRARCLSSNATKLFSISKLSLLDTALPEEDYVMNSTAESSDSIEELLEVHQDFLSTIGWHIEFDGSCISLHKRFKNGNPMKGHEVSLSFEEFTYDLVATPEGDFEKFNHRKNIKPWSVRSNQYDTKSYGTSSKAVATFLEWARKLAPSD